MKRTFFDAIVLYLLSKLNGERTIYSIYHLLKGKKSAQTIQDAHLFQLTSFFQSFELISRKELDEAVNRLEIEELIVCLSEKHYTLTEKGLSELKIIQSTIHFPEYLKGWKYHQTTDLFWERLNLLVQVSSNITYHNKRYIPIYKKGETLDWIKSFLQDSSDRTLLSKQLYDELTTCLETSCSINPSFIVSRLTGYNKIGLTPIQAAEYFGVEYFQFHIHFLNLLHYMLDMINHDKERFPLLYRICKESARPVPLTMSTKKTLDLIEAGYSLEKISKIRKLKESTIQDHIVEIALNDSQFEITPYVNLDMQRKIINAIKESGTKQLRFVRNNVNEANYFEIRLVIARIGDLE